jgi:hypothetical protein
VTLTGEDDWLDADRETELALAPNFRSFVEAPTPDIY